LHVISNQLHLQCMSLATSYTCSAASCKLHGLRAKASVWCC
jgi:hypothetical protein